MNSKSKLRNLILKISDLYNIFCIIKDLIFQAKHKDVKVCETKEMRPFIKSKAPKSPYSSKSSLFTKHALFPNL